LAELYLRTLADAPPGSLYFAESGEASWRDMAIGIGRAVGLSGEPEALPTEEPPAYSALERSRAR